MKINRFIKKWGSVILLAICVIAFWQVAFLQNGLKWDFVDAYLPARYFFSEAVLNHIFPFWNPYMLYGVPFYADLVSVFSPGYWIVANMFGYNNITLQFVFLGYVFLAGINFRYFLQKFKVSEPLAISLAVAYMLSGFTVGNAQHLSFIAAYALLPLVVASYLQLVWQLILKNLLRFSLVFLVLVLAAYPGLTVIFSYLLLAIFVYYLATFIKKKTPVRRFLIYHAIVIAIVFVGSAVLLLAYFQAQPFLSRYSGLTLDQTLMNPFTWRSFLSFVFPMSTGTDVAYFGTDSSMSNAYFGLFSLLLFLYTITGKIKEKVSGLFLFVAVFSLLAALGNRFFLREFLFNYFPLMDMFKYPAIFRAMSIFGILSFVGLNLNIKSLANEHKSRLWTIAGVLILFILVTGVRAFSKIDTFHLLDFSQSWADRIKNSTINEALVLQAGIHFILLIVFVTVVLLRNKQNYLPWILVLLFAVDGIVSTQLNIRYTAIGEVNPFEFKAHIDASPKGFPVPVLHPIGENSDKKAADKFTWRNNNVFPKRPTFDGLVSFKSDGYYLLSLNYPGVMEAMKKQPLFFFSDDVRAKNDTANLGEKTVLLDPGDMKVVEGMQLKSLLNDSLKITSFSPNAITLETKTENDQLLVFQQNNFTGWQVFVDEKQQQIVTANFALMAVVVPQGEHTIRFQYQNTWVLVLFGVSVFILLALSFALLLFHVKEDVQNRREKLWLVLAFVVLYLVLSLLHQRRYQKSKNGMLPQIEQEFAALKSNNRSGVTTFLSYASEKAYDISDADYQFYLDDNLNVADFGKILANVQTQKFAFGWVNGAVSDENRELLFSYFPVVEKKMLTENSGFILTRKGENKSYRFVEDFEPQTKSLWQIDENRITSDSIAGNSYYTFLPNEKWGASLQVTIDKESADAEKIVVLGDIRFPAKPADVNMVITVTRNKEQIDYYTQKISDFSYSNGTWSRFTLVRSCRLIEGDIVHIYLWNRTQVWFDLDNLKVKM